MAVELVRHSDSRIDRQQLAVFVNSYQRVAPLTIGELWAWPSMLKLALIENLRRLAAETLEARRARLAADAYVSRIEREAADADASRLPPALDIASVVQLLHRRPRVRPPAVVDPHGGRGAPRVAGDDRGSGDSRRAPAPGGRPGVGRQRHYQPAPLLGARLAPVRRVGQPGRAGAAARSGRRVRTDGLPEPRSAAPGGRGARGAERRRAGAGGAQGGRKRAPGGRRADRPPIGPPTSAITSSIGGGAISKPTSPIGRGSRSRVQASGVRAPDARLPGPDRDHDGAAAGRGRGVRSVRGRFARAVLAALVLLLLIPAADIAIALAQRVDRLGDPASPSASPRLHRSAVPGRRPHDGRRADAADERRRRWRRCWSTSRCSRSATSIRASISRSSATSPTPMRSDLPERRGRFSPPRAPASRISIGGSAPSTPTASFCSIARGAGTRGSTRGWDGSASAARSRNSTAC